MVLVLRTRSGPGHAQGSWEFWTQIGGFLERLYRPPKRLFGRHSAWLQAIQDSVENIMEKREEIADSG